MGSFEKEFHLSFNVERTAVGKVGRLEITETGQDDGC